MKLLRYRRSNRTYVLTTSAKKLKLKFYNAGWENTGMNGTVPTFHILKHGKIFCKTIKMDSESRDKRIWEKMKDKPVFEFQGDLPARLCAVCRKNFCKKYNLRELRTD